MAQGGGTLGWAPFPLDLVISWRPRMPPRRDPVRLQLVCSSDNGINQMDETSWLPSFGGRQGTACAAAVRLHT